ncbi:MAG: hypothetical protein ACRBN8_35040 [Nannocystales bacterium]
MMRAAPERGRTGLALVAALVSLMLLASAGWSGSLACAMDRSSERACPCEGEGAGSEGPPAASAHRPSCCASEDPSDVSVTGVLGDSSEPSGAELGQRNPTLRPFCSPCLSPPQRGTSRGPPTLLRVFLRNQALLI